MVARESAWVRWVMVMCLSPESFCGYARQSSALRGEKTNASLRAANGALTAGSLGRTPRRRACRPWRPVDAGRSLLSLVLVVDVDADGGQQHDALDHLLVIDADAEDGHAVVHHAHPECADDGAQNLAHPARRRRATDEACRNHVQFETQTCLGRCGIQTRGENKSCQSRQC